jgi:hypothetical protein
MLLKCDNTIVKQEKFWDFWKNYYPYILKKQIVRRGEHKLSQMIGFEYFQPMISLDLLSNRDINFEPPEIFQALTWSKRSSEYIYDQINFAVSLSDYSRILEICIVNLQISNSLGLWISRNLELPFKLDLPQFALCTISDLLTIAQKQGCPAQEIHELRNLLEERVNITEGSFLTNPHRFLSPK